jgi:hypothetical protein
MSNDGLAVTPEGTTAAPTLYEEVEQGDEVAKGHVAVKEIIAYDFVERKKVIEKDKLGNEIGSKWVIIENGRKPYFCQTKEQELIFKENNPGVREVDSNKVVIAASGVRTESFSIQLLKSTAIKYLNDPRNVKQFTKKEPIEIKETVDTPEKLDWLHQAHRLGIPTDGRTKEDIVSEIAASKQIPTTTSVS